MQHDDPTTLTVIIPVIVPQTIGRQRRSSRHSNSIHHLWHMGSLRCGGPAHLPKTDASEVEIHLLPAYLIGGALKLIIKIQRPRCRTELQYCTVGQ